MRKATHRPVKPTSNTTSTTTTDALDIRGSDLLHRLNIHAEALHGLADLTFLAFSEEVHSGPGSVCGLFHDLSALLTILHRDAAQAASMLDQIQLDTHHEMRRTTGGVR